jgi:hypothetical protein
MWAATSNVWQSPHALQFRKVTKKEISGLLTQAETLLHQLPRKR